MSPKMYVGTRGCLPTAGVSWGCLMTTIGYVVCGVLLVRKVRR